MSILVTQKDGYIKNGTEAELLKFAIENKLYNLNWFQIISSATPIQIVYNFFNKNYVKTVSSMQTYETVTNKQQTNKTHLEPSVMTKRIDDTNFKFKFNLNDPKTRVLINDSIIEITIKNVINKNKKQLIICTTKDGNVNDLLVDENYNVRYATFIDTLEMI